MKLRLHNNNAFAGACHFFRPSGFSTWIFWESTNREELVETLVTSCDAILIKPHFSGGVVHSWHYTAFKQQNAMPTLLFIKQIFFFIMLEKNCFATL